MDNKKDVKAEVISVYPDKIKIVVDNLEDFQVADEKLKVGSYLRVSDNDNAVLLAVIENYSIEIIDNGDDADHKYIIEANPLGIVRDGKFERGGDTIAIPPKDVNPATKDDIDAIYSQSIDENKKFVFAKLSSNPDISVPVDGNKFFNKHIAIVGSTGSGKSHTVAKIIQSAVSARDGSYTGLNNSHIIIFDIHSEYKNAFPDANRLDVSNIILPYWLLNGDELQELFIDTEAHDHNQRNVFKEAVIESKRSHLHGSPEEKENIKFDSPFLFDINDVLNFIKKKNEERIPSSRSGDKAGPLFGQLSNFISRLENRINDKRLDFLMGQKVLDISFVDTLKQFLGYGDTHSNINIIY